MSTATIRSPFDGHIVGQVPLGDAVDLERAMAQAAARFVTFSRSATHHRALLLERIALGIDREAEPLARLISNESGKPLRYARAEVARATVTFRVAAGECRRLGGEVLPSDQLPAQEGRLTLYRRVPRGPIAAISPFNFPLNLVAHKLAPALAVGAPVVLKVPPQAPLTALRLQDLVREAGAEPDVFRALHLAPEVAERLAVDPRLPVLSFTGSDRVGWHLASLATKKRVLLELGGNAPCILDDTADLDDALPRLLEASFGSAGQVCIKAQRIYCHAARYEEFLERFVEGARALPTGDPLDEATIVGPMIDSGQVERVKEWLEEALAGGAERPLGGEARGNLMPPTILTGAKPEHRVCKDELFAPVTVVERVETFEEGLARANDSRFGIQASVFTRDLSHALTAFERLAYPGVLVNDAPSFRTDNVPYGGVRDSGLGREGVAFAIDEYTEPKLLSLRKPSE